MLGRKSSLRLTDSARKKASGRAACPSTLPIELGIGTTDSALL